MLPRPRAPLHRATAVLLVAALGSSLPGLAAAAPAAGTASEPDPLEQAQRLYDRGRAKFETADYADAIELWTEAYANIPETPESSQIKALLLYNIATAREKQYDVSRDAAELRQAAILLQSFEQSIPALYGDGAEAEAERTKVQERLAAVQERIRQHEAAEAERQGDDEPEDAEPTTPTTPTTPTQPDDGEAKGARGLVIGGAVAAGLGVGALGLMAAGLGLGARANDISGLAPDDIDGRRAQFDRGRTGNVLAIAGGVAGGALLVTGAVLLGLGLKRRSAGNVALVPAPTRGGTALVLSGRF